MSTLTLMGETPQGEIVTEVVEHKVKGRIIYIHGIGLHPFDRTGLHAFWNPRVTHRMWAERLAAKYVVEPVVILTDHHKTGRIYAVHSQH